MCDWSHRAQVKDQRYKDQHQAEEQCTLWKLKDFAFQYLHIASSAASEL